MSASSSALAPASFRAGGAGAKAVGFGRVAGIPSAPLGTGLPAIRGRDALDTSGDDFNGAALDEQRFSIHQGIGDFSVRRFEDPAERLAGNAHLLRSIGLIKPLQISQADRLELIDGQCHLL